MLARLKPPGGERTLYAAAYLLLAIYFLARGLPAGRSLMVMHGSGMALAGVVLWIWRDWSRWVGVAMLSPFVWFGVTQSFRQGFSVLYAITTLGCLWFAYGVWRAFAPDRRPVRAGSGEAKPMISFVLLLREPRFLEAPILAEIVSSAWGGTYTASDPDSDAPQEDASGSEVEERFVMGRSPLFVVHSPDAMYVVHNLDQPYFDEPAKAAEEMPELRLRHAVEQHRAWIAVDLVAPFDEARDPRSYYPAIARLIAELSGADCLAIFHPDSGTINAWDQSLEEKLRGPNALEEFAEPVHVPVIQIPDDDPRMQAAVAEARRRWPEFVAAFKARSSESYAVKAPVTVEGHTEFIWMDVIGLEPEYVHGTLANDPVALEGLKLGDRVEVLVSEINDWFYLNGEEPVGWFTVKVVAAIQKEQAKARDQRD